LLLALVSAISAQSRGRLPAAAPDTPATAPAAARATAVSAVPAAHQTFTTYCVECHSGARPKGGVSFTRLLEQLSSVAVGEQGETWDKVAEMLETRQMPPDDAEAFPSDTERAAATAWVRSTLKDYEAAHGGDPGRVTVRRLTSAEYSYAVRDLTGIDIKVGIDASSDAVGGEGFANFGDVQFVQDATVERYLEAARQIADHAILGSGPLGFYGDTGRTGLELSALDRVQRLYADNGFRAVSGEGGRPFGFDRYAKAFLVAWRYKHRAALGEPTTTVRALAAREGVTGRFAEHIWEVVNRTGTGYPSADMIGAWQQFAAPTADAAASIARARSDADALTKKLVTWPSWFFARGDLAAGGAGDESPLLFDDTTLGAKTTHSYTYALNRRFGRPTPGQPPQPQVGPGPWTVHLTFDALNKGAGTPVVIYRNPRVALRTPASLPGPFEPAAITRARVPGPILKTLPLRELLPAAEIARLQFGVSVDGVAIGANDFAATGPLKIELNVDHQGYLAELHTDVELGANRDAVVRVMLANRPDGVARMAGQRVFMGDPASAGYKVFRAGIAEFVSLMPPNSHGEANPADKDPVPAPFDNTYNSPEHDAFVTKVKYQRTDAFFTQNMVDGADRAALEFAWNDVFGSWPYHQAYLDMLLEHYGVKAGGPIARMTPAAIAALPPEARPHVRRLRADYDRVTKAMAEGEPGHVTDALAFASRAWRRPLTPAERASLRGFYRTLRTVNRLDHDAGVRALLARILMSPAFLYRVEGARVEPAPTATDTALNDWELASRLSFFLWSSIPDEELRRASTAGELRDVGKLESQVRRMTADPKARRLATEFFGQWLGFYHFDQYRGIDTGRFPEFTDAVKTSMYDEAVSTFEYLVRQGRPVKEILHADYTFLNKTLATFYGIDVPLKSTTGEMERVDGAHAFDRGGALRLGSVLATTSAPLRTSPVKRGDWVLRRILSTPTPPPPADAGTLPADDKSFEGLTLRERLTKHKRDAKCASCHLRIDPLGFPLEGFDAVGRTRQTYNDGKPVDVTGEFRDKTTIVGSRGLLDYLQTQDAKVMKTLARKMLGYALGRNPQASDRRLIGEMMTAGGDASFADLAVKIATSRQFRHRSQGSGSGPVPDPVRESPTTPSTASGSVAGSGNNP
jgi:mono/diheme cytochrome c family protein